jgi:hypothetical protein
MSSDPNTPYQQAPVQPMQPMQQDCSLATISLVFGILAYIILPFVGSLVAVITGHSAIKQIKASNGMLRGMGNAKAGLILGYIQIGFEAIAIIVIVVLSLLAPAIGSTFSGINSTLTY